MLWAQLWHLNALLAHLVGQAALFCHRKEKGLTTFFADQLLIAKHHL
jgi:hypothetical protein